MHGIMGRRFPDGGLLRYRKWVPQPSRNCIRRPGVVGKTIKTILSRYGRKNRKLSGNLLPIIPWRRHIWRRHHIYSKPSRQKRQKYLEKMGNLENKRAMKRRQCVLRLGTGQQNMLTAAHYSWEFHTGMKYWENCSQWSAAQLRHRPHQIRKCGHKLTKTEDKSVIMCSSAGHCRAGLQQSAV